MNSLFPQDVPASDSEDAVVIRPGRKPRSKKQTNKNAAPAETTSTAAQNEEASDVNHTELIESNAPSQEAQVLPPPNQEDTEPDPDIFNIEKIVNHRRVGRGYQFLVK